MSRKHTRKSHAAPKRGVIGQASHIHSVTARTNPLAAANHPSPTLLLQTEKGLQKEGNQPNSLKHPPLIPIIPETMGENTSKGR